MYAIFHTQICNNCSDPKIKDNQQNNSGKNILPIVNLMLINSALCCLMNSLNADN